MKLHGDFPIVMLCMEEAILIIRKVTNSSRHLGSQLSLLSILLYNYKILYSSIEARV